MANSYAKLAFFGVKTKKMGKEPIKKGKIFGGLQTFRLICSIEYARYTNSTYVRARMLTKKLTRPRGNRTE